MPNVFGFNIIYPSSTRKLFDSQRVKAMVLNAMKKEGNKMVKEISSTVVYWEHRPNFDKEIRYKGGNPILIVGMRGSQLASKYWNYVDKGTRVRYVIFHPFYHPKTEVPGTFFTNTPGFMTRRNQKIIGRSKKALRGIRARMWSEKLKKDHRASFKEAIDDAILRGLQPK